MDYKAFYENYHRLRLLPKRIITQKNFTYRHIVAVLDRYCQGKTVLDFGSGVGTLALYLARQGKQVTGIEVAPKAVAVAKKSAAKFRLDNQVKFLLGDIFKSNLKQKFDFVICSEVLEHLHDDGRALDKIYSLLKPTGRLLVSVPSQNAPLIKLGAIKEFDAWSGHLRRYTLESLTALLNQHHFKVIFAKKNEGIIRDSLFVFPALGTQIIRLANRFGIISDLITIIDNLALKFFGESQLIIVAKPLRKA
ncbi:MAG: class I SAM-dependent methyltransferase [Patescibacteria group bacterium]|nr:class I SAM-dependent methyltransferase [Patescibacteria group bacterium]